MSVPRAPTVEELLAHERWLRGLLRGLLDDADVDDVLQETWITALRRPPRAVAALRGWLARVAANLARNASLRERRRRRNELAVELPGEAESSDDVVQRLALQELVTGAVMNLAEPYRTTIFHRYYDELTTAQIAARMGTTEANVRQRVHRGQALLRERLGQRLGADWRTSHAVLALMPARPAVLFGTVPAAAAALVLLGGLAWLALSSSGSEPVAPRSAPLASAGGGPTLEPEPVATGAPVQRREVAAGSTLRVRVRWSDGSPAAGVQVAIRPAADASWLREQWVETDAGGEVRLETAPAEALVVRADRGGEPRVVAAAPGPRDVELDLPAAIAVAGTVRDARGELLEGARVWLADPARGLDEGTVVAHSDREGNFVLRDVAAGRSIGVLPVAGAPGNAPAVGLPARVVEGAPGDRLELELQLRSDCGTVRGRVRDASGAVLPEAAVLLGWSRSFHAAPVPPVLRLRTDAGGRFAATLAADVRVPLWVGAPGHAPWCVVIDVAPGEALELEVPLAHGARLAGTVRDEQGRALAGVAVEVWPEDFGLRAEGRELAPGWARFETKSAPDGGFVFEHLPSGRAIVVARRATSVAITPVELAERAAHVVDPLLGGPGRIHGTLRDATGALLAGVDVTATPPLGAPLTASSDAAGAFVLDGCAAAPHRLAVRPRESALAEGTVVLVDARPADAPLALTVPDEALARAWLVGALRDHRGAAPLQAQISLIRCAHGTERLACRRAVAADGSFRIGPLPAGEYEVVVSSPATGARSLGPCALRAGEDHDLGTHAFDAPGGLELTVLDAGGAPSGLAFATVRLPGQVWNASVRLAGGRGARPAMQPGEYYALVSARSVPAAWRTFTITPGATTRVELRCERGVPRWLRYPARAEHGIPLTFTLRTKAGDVVARETVAWPLDASDTGAPVMKAASFVPGSYELEVGGRDGASTRTAFTVTDGDPTSVVDVALPPER